MANKSVYDIPNEQLIEAFKTAAVNVGAAHVSESLGLVFHMNYLAGVVLARLDGSKPPMDKTDVVRLKNPRGGIGAEERVVDRIYYFGDKLWMLYLTNEKGSYPAEQFELVRKG